MTPALFHNGREIDPSAIDYGDGSVMVSYVDTGEVVVIEKSEIEVREAGE